LGEPLWGGGYGSGSNARSIEGPDLINVLLLPFEILPSRFEVLGFIECGLGVCSQPAQFILESEVAP